MKLIAGVLVLTAAMILGSVTLSAAEDPIVGKWQRPNGIIVQFSPCGPAFCAVPVTGPNAGKDAGRLSATGNGKYKGTLTDLEANKTYKGKGSISGNTLSVSGCVLAILCKNEDWVRQ